MTTDLKKIDEIVKQESIFIDQVLQEANKVIVGQKNILERIVMGILSDGHILIEGVPGLAKTLTVNTIAQVFDLSFKRIQFTPDLLPADLLGTMIYNPSTQKFATRLGPIFAHIILADEINRAPAKVQSSLLEAMEEKQVTISDKTHKIPIALPGFCYSKPVEEQGTYNLPEAQVDRFIMKLQIKYPAKEEEKLIIERMSTSIKPKASKIVGLKDIERVKKVIDYIYIDEKIKEYVLDIVDSTRNPEKYNLEKLKPLINYGASPRASLALIKVAKAHAFINRRGYVTPEDIKAIGKDVLRHRIIPSFEAEAEEISVESIINSIFSEIEVP